MLKKKQKTKNIGSIRVDHKDRAKKLLDLEQNLLLWQLFTVGKAMHLKDMTQFWGPLI